MQVIGLTGGIASGKSAVAEELAQLGATVLDADRAAHQAINLPQVKQALVDRWGEQVLLDSGEVDRRAIAKLVFSPHSSGESSEKLQFLEGELHPRIRRDFETLLAELATKEVPAAVIDAPLLLEAGWESLCDVVVFVDCPAEIRQQRALERNWRPEELLRREAAQMPIEEKRRRATHVLDNQGSLEDLRRQVRLFWKSLQ